jgi:hypothetical protein
MLLGRLEDEAHGAVEVAPRGQQLCRAQQHGHVAVVPAGVHAAGVRGRIGRSAGASVSASASMSARRPITPLPLPTVRLATTPVPPMPRCTCRPSSCSSCATRSAVRRSLKPVSGKRWKSCRQRTHSPASACSSGVCVMSGSCCVAMDRIVCAGR